MKKKFYNIKKYFYKITILLIILSGISINSLSVYAEVISDESKNQSTEKEFLPWFSLRFMDLSFDTPLETKTWSLYVPINKEIWVGAGHKNISFLGSLNGIENTNYFAGLDYNLVYLGGQYAAFIRVPIITKIGMRNYYDSYHLKNSLGKNYYAALGVGGDISIGYIFSMRLDITYEYIFGTNPDDIRKKYNAINHVTDSEIHKGGFVFHLGFLGLAF